MPVPVRAASSVPAHRAVPPLESARQLLERSLELPAARGAAPPPAVYGLLRALGRAGAAAAGLGAAIGGALFASSRGELTVLQLQGKVPPQIDLKQFQRAATAFERWAPAWRMPPTWTPQQVGRAIGEAGALLDRLDAGTISLRRFDEEMSRRMGQIGARARPPASRETPVAVAAQARATQANRPPAQQGSDAIRALGRAIRDFGQTPTVARRVALNDLYALARSRHARDGVRHWTPATQSNFRALAPQADRALYGPAPKPGPAGLPARGWQPGTVPGGRGPGLPELRSEIAPARGGGVRTGAGAGELEWRALEQRADALERARRLFHERSRTQLPGGSREDLARALYAELGGAKALGSSEDAFVAQVRRPGSIRGADPAGRVRAGTDGSGAAAWLTEPIPKGTSLRDRDPGWGGALAGDAALANRLQALQRRGWTIRIDPRAQPDVAQAVPGSRTLVLPSGLDPSGAAVAGPRLAGALERAIGTAGRLEGRLDAPRPSGRRSEFAFEPAVMQSEYRQRDVMNGVIWFTPEQAGRYAIELRDGRLSWAQGRGPVDSTRATSRHGGPGTMTIVLDMQGRLYGCMQSYTYHPSAFTQKAQIFHSSFTGGGDLAFAGEMRVLDGRLEAVTDESWHYRPQFMHSAQFIDWLLDRGVDLDAVGFQLFEGVYPKRR